MSTTSRSNAVRIGAGNVTGVPGHTHASSEAGTGGWQPMQEVLFPTPSATWVLDIGRFVNVVVLDSTNEVVIPGSIVYGPGTVITMGFSSALSGKVHCYS